MSNIKAIILRGDFTEAEFAELVALIRRLDHARPDAHFEMVAVDPLSTGLETAERVLREALPPHRERHTDWEVRRHSNRVAARISALITNFPGTEMPNTQKNTFYCSFCGKSQHETKQLIAGPSVFICDECVDLCATIVKEKRDSLTASPPANDEPGPTA